MVNQAAGIEVVIFILWILFSIYGSMQKKKKQEQQKSPAKPVAGTGEPAEDPFKKILEELLGKQGEPEAPRQKKKPEIKPAPAEYKKPVYTSIPSDYKGTQGSMPSSATIAAQHASAIDNLSSIESAYEKPHFLRPEEEGVSSTASYMQAAATVTSSRRTTGKRSVLINGNRVSMRDALVAQVLLEKKI